MRWVITAVGHLIPPHKRWVQFAWPSTYCSEVLGDYHFERTLPCSIGLCSMGAGFRKFPVVLGCAVWGQDFANSGVVVHCDNQGAVALVNSHVS